jgi:predicted nucleic acid-binding protein
MTSNAFLDTNIVVYAMIKRGGVPQDRRTRIADQIVSDGGVISVQVLSEFSDVVSRKHGQSWNRIGEMLEVIQELCGPPVPLTAQTFSAALELSTRYRFRIYDSLILAAAEQAGCNTVYSEDMQHGQTIGNIRIENPFRAL